MPRIARVAFILLIGLVMVGVPACGPKEPPPPPAPPPPPPPTPEEIAAKISADLGLNNPLPPAGSRLSAEDAQALKSGIQRAKSANSATPDGKRALQIVSSKLDQRIQAMEANQLWEHVIAGIQGHETLNPGSPKWQTSKELAMAELRKPKVTITGFMTTHGQDYALLEFYLPVDKKTEKERVRVGEEFYGLKMTQIIGNNQGVRFEYLETGQVFDVLKASARD